MLARLRAQQDDHMVERDQKNLEIKELSMENKRLRSALNDQNIELKSVQVLNEQECQKLRDQIH